MAKLEITGMMNFLKAKDHIIESTCSCGECGIKITKIEEGDTVEVSLRKGMFIKTIDGAILRVKDFTIEKLP